uniref:Uncharacterized protein n=1 Tax=Anguilla anguilla TaxID=7936 RepID=A0A0E9PHC6_ANGAN
MTRQMDHLPKLILQFHTNGLSGRKYETVRTRYRPDSQTSSKKANCKA